MSVETVILTIQTLTLVAVSVLLAYPIAKYSSNVAYTQGMVTLSAAFFALSIGYAIGMFTPYLIVERVVILLSAVLGLIGVTYFARPFIEFDETDSFADEHDHSGEQATGDEEPITEEGVGDTEGGFGDAVRE